MTGVAGVWSGGQSPLSRTQERGAAPLSNQAQAGEPEALSHKAEDDLGGLLVQSSGKQGRAEKQDYGRTVGNPQLSDGAYQYYKELKGKYGNVDFILVEDSIKDEVHGQAAQYATPGRLVVLINAEKVERMAVDESARKEYEGKITAALSQTGFGNAASGDAISQLFKSMTTRSSSVKTAGINLYDNGVGKALNSFFAVVDKSLASQKERIKKKAEKKKTEKKKEEKKAAKKKAEERLTEKAEEKKAAKAEQEARFLERGDAAAGENAAGSGEDLVVVTASSWDELARKVDDVMMDAMSDQVFTEEELKVGQHIDLYS